MNEIIAIAGVLIMLNVGLWVGREFGTLENVFDSFMGSLNPQTEFEWVIREVEENKRRPTPMILDHFGVDTSGFTDRAKEIGQKEAWLEFAGSTKRERDV